MGAVEDARDATVGLTPEQLWTSPAGAASVGFHLLHLSGSTDRLLTYARGERLSDIQKETLAYERSLAEPRPALETMLRDWEQTVDRALAQLGRTPDADLDAPRGIGRMAVPSNVRGLLFHAAEHATRHVGQVITTSKIIRGLGLSGPVQEHPSGESR
jgi:uncharacterized damage-inducible protein DinB